MNYFLTGIKGSGMTALACILKDMGNNVSGSDVENVYFTDAKLIAKEIEFTAFNTENITSDIDVLILGNAFADDHEEVLKAKELGIEVIRYYKYVAKLAKEYQSIAIAGTNGKTTTTGLVKAMLQDQELISLIGDGTGEATPNAEYFVFEACEYKNTFWNYESKLGIINNIEFDHPDFFKDLDHVVETYQGFADRCEKVLIFNDDKNCRRISAKNLITFGIDTESDVMFKNVEKVQGGFNFDLVIKGEKIGSYLLPFAGDHMISNSLCSIAIAYVKGLDLENAITNLATFTGVTRRFEIEVIDEEKNIVMIDDYAHHPTAIELTIDAIRQKYPECEVTVLFQPHTYSRTVAFLDEFAESLTKADNVYLADIFGSVREAKGDIDINVLVNAVEAKGQKVERTIDFIKDRQENHVVAVLGAGNIDKLYKDKIRSLYRS